ncbi:MAG TPA: hypothetical protein VJV79_21915, partial [Polyangiaceae bacterium]|nr:hypothetical protein [Polyangiaceae bacterium]
YCAASPQDPTGVSKVCTAFTPSPHGTVNEACSFSCEGSVCWDPEAVGQAPLWCRAVLALVHGLS